MKALGYSAKRYSSDPKRRKLSDVHEKARHLCTVLEADDTQKPVLITSEALCCVLPGRKNTWDYAATPSILEALVTELKLHFGPTIRVHIVFSTRNAESWMRSVYWQNLRSNRILESFSEFQAKLEAGADLDLIVAATKSRLRDRAVVEDFNISNPSNLSGLFEFMLARLSITHGKLKLARNRNTQPPDGIETLLRLNRSALSMDEVAVEKRKFLDSIKMNNNKALQK